MAKLDFGGVQETVVTRSEFTLAKAQETLKGKEADVMKKVSKILSLLLTSRQTVKSERISASQKRARSLSHRESERSWMRITLLS